MNSAGDLFPDEAPAKVPVAAASVSAASSGAAASPFAPLAERMRPRSLDEVLGPQELVGNGSFLRKAVAGGTLPSLVFWGPPGTGKTTLARLLSLAASARFVAFSAVVSGIKEIREVMLEASRALSRGERTVLFVDEIHRFNRAQQDAFLPHVESGAIVLVGATTENPSFELNGALLSRLRVVVLPGSRRPRSTLLARARIARASPGASRRRRRCSRGSRAFRTATAVARLVALENGAFAAGADGELTIRSSNRSTRGRLLLHDKVRRGALRLISALHKRLRDSDVDGSVYWLARMLEGGEDPLYVARRLIRFASEDVGLADSRALGLAVAARDAVHTLGMPEGALALAQVCVFLALAPKSNAIYKAYGEAVSDVRTYPNEPPPLAIRNAPTKLLENLGYGRDYVYAHDTEAKTAGLDTLPERFRGRTYYRPSGQGSERELAERVKEVRARRQARREGRKRDGRG
jgi:putative ATPase